MNTLIGFGDTTIMQAPVSRVKLLIEVFSMWTVPAFWMSMPTFGNGASVVTPEMSRPRNVMTSVSPALMTMPVVRPLPAPRTLIPP